MPTKGRIWHSWGVILGEECEEEMRESRGKREEQLATKQSCDPSLHLPTSPVIATKPRQLCERL